MFGCVGLGSKKFCGSRNLGQWRSAITAELLAGRICGSAGRAHGRKLCSTLTAKFLTRRIIVLAPRTLHTGLHKPDQLIVKRSPDASPVTKTGQETQEVTVGH